MLLPFSGMVLHSSFTVSAAQTIIVNSKADTEADDGECTLREAITAANINTASGATLGECIAGDAGSDTITFNITGIADFTNGGQNGYTITPVTSLPQISDTVIIDGYTQPGAQANTASAPNPLNGRLLIEINGNDQFIHMIDFIAGSDGSRVSGLTLNRTQSNAIRIIGASDVLIQGNYVGTDPTGLIARPNGSDNTNSSTAIDIGDFGTLVTDTSTVGNVIGGVNPQDRNIVSGNYGGAFGVIGVDSEFYGNYFGLGSDGLTTLGNSTGTGVTTGVLTIDYADGVQIGNGQLSGMNIISGNSRAIQPDYSTNITIVGNRIGTDYTGSQPRPNLTHGISLGLGTTNVRIGGPNDGDGNIVAYNSQFGIETWTTGDRVNDVVIENNTIRNNGLHNIAIVYSDDISVIGNTIENSGSAGVFIADSTEITIGGDTANEGNVITESSSLGINVVGFQSATSSIAVQGNTITNNTIGGVSMNGFVTDSIIGGTSVSASNRISNNTGFGVAIARFNASGIPLVVTPSNITVLSNSISRNTTGQIGQGLGIDHIEMIDASVPPDGQPESLNLIGPTLNDSGDVDTGPNGLINFPVVNFADQNLFNLSVDFDLDAAGSPTNQYRVEFFANDSADDSGYGEGQTFLGSAVASPGSGQIASLTLPTGTNLTGKVLSATATAIDGATTSGFGSTSEFSLTQAITVSALPQETTSSGSESTLANTGQNIVVLLTVAAGLCVGALVVARRRYGANYSIRN